MSVGSLVLILLETDPALPAPGTPLQAVEGRRIGPEPPAIRQGLAVPLQFIKWRNIVVHDTGRHGAQVANGCHFIIGNARKLGDGAVSATPLWRRQQDGRHIHVPGLRFNVNSIGICLLRDCRRGPPTERQFQALGRLVRALQATCFIPAEQVYLHSELGGQDCPGRFFQAKAFHDVLLPSTN